MQPNRPETPVPGLGGKGFKEPQNIDSLKGTRARLDDAVQSRVGSSKKHCMLVACVCVCEESEPDSYMFSTLGLHTVPCKQ